MVSFFAKHSFIASEKKRAFSIFYYSTSKILKVVHYVCFVFQVVLRCNEYFANTASNCKCSYADNGCPSGGGSYVGMVPYVADNVYYLIVAPVKT